MVFSLQGSIAGFDKTSQEVKDTNIFRFKGSHGIGSNTVCVMFSDVKYKSTTQNLKDVIMAMNWVMLYNSWEVMAEYWKYSEPAIAKGVTVDLSGIERLFLALFKKMRLTL